MSSRRRSSLTHSLRYSGGVNSLDRFASSYTRAQSFLSIDTSTLRQTLASYRLLPQDDGAVDDSDSLLFAPETSDDEAWLSPPRPGFSGPLRNSPGNYAALGAARADRADKPVPTVAAVATNADERLAGGTALAVDEASGSVLVVPGRSTAPQTVFNSVNVLVGIGLLSLPLAFAYAGWAIGTLFIVAAALTTLYTAKVLARCLDTDETLVTYADIAFAAYGQRARVATSVLFSIELIGACVALVVLFADSLHALYPAIDNDVYKAGAFFVLAPLMFLPLSVLSFTSVLGILSTFGLVVIVFVDGLIKRDQPGSLWQPMETHALPTNWMALPLSFGLLMSPWCGHSVFPNVYRDMRHPYKFNRCLNLTYTFTFLVDLSMALLGLVMFGNLVSDEITENILQTAGYPRALSYATVVMIAIIPLSKTPLNARPIISTLEALLGVDKVVPREPLAKQAATVGPRAAIAHWYASYRADIVRALVRVSVTFVIVVIAILFPAFDRIMAFVGSGLGFTICITLPMIYYLKIFAGTGRISRAERSGAFVLITISVILAVLGTIWSLLPSRVIFGY
ncbi:transmembrane amino acid transporter protein-domain-containing protein [Dipodascopsis tothii]|uniref:transmembrane amino acid transporter protein-domain-containing protein n=1 Tax=Dipodascopsis tothii TaxID=44089 RepID=UPI0034CD3122